MTGHRSRRLGPLLLAASTLGALAGPGAALAEGPGYGGNADTLTVQWQRPTSGEGLGVYALGFKGGSPVSLRVGAAAEQSIVADAAGALRVLVVSAASTPAPAPTPDTTVLPVTGGAAGGLASGMSVLAVGTTPAGAMRTLVGSVPPAEAGWGIQDVAPWGAAAAVLGGAVFWSRRRGLPTMTAALQRRLRRSA
jgi:MYXO-CTERM domain-containing protein